MQLTNSPTRDVITCGECNLRQFLADSCCRCHQPLGVTYLEMPLPLSSESTGLREPQRNLLGSIVRQLRLLKCGRSHAWLADSTHTHRTHASRIESGDVMPAVSTLIRIAAVLGVDSIRLCIRGSGIKPPHDRREKSAPSAQIY